MEKTKQILTFFRTNLKIVVPLVIVIVAVTGFIATKGGKSSLTYQTSKVERGTISSSVSASGQILSGNIVNINSTAKGLVKKVYVKDGDKVFSGQKIMEITLDLDSAQKSTSAYASYLSAKNSLDSANVSLYTLQSQEFAANQKFINDAAARGLATNDPTYIQEYADWKAAEAKYINQQKVIQQSQVSVSASWLSYQAVSPKITAPMSGTISNITYTDGMTLFADSSRIAVIKSVGNPLASFNISEIDVSKVKVGQKAIIKLDSLTDKTFSGKIATIDRLGTVASNVTNYPVVIKFDTESADILPNMSASANIILETKNDVLLVPNSAIQKQQNQNYIRLLKNGKEVLSSVEIGLASDSQTEIIFGVSEGDDVITSTISQTTTTNQGSSVFSSGALRGGATFRTPGR